MIHGKVWLLIFPFVHGVATGDGYVGGKFYWFARICGRPSAPELVLFDFNDEALEWIALPQH